LNRLVLSARIAERGTLRHNPAGVPLLDLGLQHESELDEAGQPRKVSVRLRAVAIGEITRPLLAMPLGGAADFAGFLAAARNGRALLFHVTAVDAAAGLDQTHTDP
jgi:primosomal replication protein N